jgi:mannose-6-phosphate isomerase-like protein (cupin superfamily)
MADTAFIEDGRRAARRNSWFRNVIYTGRFNQIIAMSIAPEEETGEEIYSGHDHIYLVVEGDAEASVAGKTRAMHKHDVVCVRAGVRHNIRNAGMNDVKLLAVCSPPAFAEGTIHRTREDAIGAMVYRSA